MPEIARPTPALLALSWVIAATICFAFYSLVIIRHFEAGGVVEDSGWFAYLMSSGDPLLTNPRSVNGLSYYAHHLSPVLYIWSIVFNSGFGFAGITGFALYFGFSALLVLVPFALLSLRNGLPAWQAYLAVAVAAVFTLTNIPMIRALDYPHFEIAFPGLVGVLFLCLLRKRLLPALITIAIMALVREDGGLFAAYTVTVYWAANVRFDDKAMVSRCLALFTLSLALSVLGMIVQHVWFPGFATFSSNFSGNHFDHITIGFLLHRLGALFTNFGAAPAILISVILGMANVRYAFPLLFMLPLIVLQLVSVRDVIGTFQLHYGIPFAIVGLLILIMALFDSARMQQSKVVWIAIFALLAVNHAPTRTWVTWVTQAPEFSIPASQRYIEELTPDENHSICGSVGVLALAPDRFAREQFVKGEIPDHCTSVILFEGDLDYRRLHPLMSALAFSRIDKLNRLELYRRQ